MKLNCPRILLVGSSALVAGFIGCAGAAVSADLGTGPAPAPLVEPLRNPSQWTFNFTPYAWVPWIQGDMAVKGRQFNVDVTPVEILENLDKLNFMWISYMEARRGPLSLYADIFYANFGGTTSFIRSRSRSPHVSGTLGAAASADYETAIVEAGGAYEIARWPASWHSGSAGYTAFDLLAGARYWHQETDVSVSLTGTVVVDPGLTITGSRARAASGSVDWVDPFIGARLRHHMGPGEEIVLKGDIGGFGVGSQFSWQLLGAYNWLLCATPGYTIDGYLGYRALSVDYDQGSGSTRFEYNTIQHGPVTGLTVRF